MKWRRAYWWFNWQAWLFAHPPQDASATTRWMWGRLGFFLLMLVLQTVALTALAIVLLWARWAFDL